MTSQEMFEKQGYNVFEATQVNGKPTKIRYSKANSDTFSIAFYVRERNIVTGRNNMIDAELLKAIAKQAKELGWLSNDE